VGGGDRRSLDVEKKNLTEPTYESRGGRGKTTGENGIQAKRWVGGIFLGLRVKLSGSHGEKVVFPAGKVINGDGKKLCAYHIKI